MAKRLLCQNKPWHRKHAKAFATQCTRNTWLLFHWTGMRQCMWHPPKKKHPCIEFSIHCRRPKFNKGGHELFLVRQPSHIALQGFLVTMIWERHQVVRYCFLPSMGFDLHSFEPSRANPAHIITTVQKHTKWQPNQNTHTLVHLCLTISYPRKTP